MIELLSWGLAICTIGAAFSWGKYQYYKGAIDGLTQGKRICEKFHGKIQP